nr:MAG TPA: hypothetical protein [Caudoviricetes sp.]
MTLLCNKNTFFSKDEIWSENHNHYIITSSRERG